MIIGLTGLKGCGKDTVADYLVEAYGFQKVGFSDSLYDAVCKLWGITHEEAFRWKGEDKRVGVIDGQFPMTTIGTFTWREHLQRIGTEMGRSVFGEDFWVEVFEDRYLAPGKVIGIDHNFVVRDVRFNNEAEMLYDYVADIWQVIRPGLEPDGHVSEAGIDDRFIRGDIGNDGTIAELHSLLDDWMVAAYGPRAVKHA